MSTHSPVETRDLARSVFEAVFHETESFREGNVGADLAYLMGAILKNTPNDVRLDCEHEGGHEGILAALTDSFPSEHAVWTFVHRDFSAAPERAAQTRRSRKATSKVEFNSIDDALSRCRDTETESLEEFLDSLLDEELDVLAQLPGTPGQVLSAQFTYYIRSSVDLTEALIRNKTKSQALIETIHRLPEIKKRRRNSRSNDHDPAASDSEAAA
ncbi:MAG: hypothetical protein WCT04_26270 [Planctomycetota bacterium]